jgi:hypothetical protein
MRSSISKKGKVKVTVVSEQGKEVVVAILDANEFSIEPGFTRAARN